MKDRAVKAPVVMQMEALECGAASLCMIAAYYGKWVPLEKMRVDCGVSRDGSSARNLLRAAREMGMEARACRYELDAVREAPFPVIIHWNFNHFLVLRGFRRGRALLNDPARGAIEVDLKEFDEAFTGVVLEFSPTAAFVKDGKPHSVLRFAAKRLRSSGPALVFVALTALSTALSGLLVPLFGQVFLDAVLPGGAAISRSGFFALFILLALLFALSVFLRDYQMMKIRGRLAVSANSAFLWRVLRLPMEFFQQRFAGDIAERQASNEGIAETLIVRLAPVALNLGMVVFYLTVMLRYSPPLAAVGVAAAAVNVFAARAVSARRLNLTRRRMSVESREYSAMTAGVEMIETIKASGCEDGYFRRWAGFQARGANARAEYARLNQYLGALPQLLQAAANVVILVLGVRLIMAGGFTTGMLIAFQGFLSQFMTPFNELVESGQAAEELRGEMERVEDVFGYPPALPEERPDRPPRGGRFTRAEMKNLSFGYARLAPPVLTDFSLRLEPGRSVALVGASGCGKSTVAKLLSGLYAPWSGSVSFDGEEISSIDRGRLTASLAVVDQDITLFEDSIAANLRMWDDTIEDFEIILGARDAGIHDDIIRRDGGYAHIMRENGKDFSGGQRQRMEIARVLAQDPTILILDEATSALDAQTEYRVARAIRDRGIACLIVAHRLSTVRDCDEIIVLEKGRIVQRGTHEALYAEEGGLYRRLVTSE